MAKAVKVSDAVDLPPFSVNYDTGKKRCNKCGMVMSESITHTVCPPPDEVKAAIGNYVWPTEGTEGRKY